MPTTKLQIILSATFIASRANLQSKIGFSGYRVPSSLHTHTEAEEHFFGKRKSVFQRMLLDFILLGQTRN